MSVAELPIADKRRIVAWQLETYPAYLPLAVRRLDYQTRLRIATSLEYRLAWEERERRRCRADHRYFVEAYCSIEDNDGNAVPFELWPEQERALAILHAEPKVVILKARQLGLSWMALEYGLWKVGPGASSGSTPRAFVFCKNSDDAGKQVQRLKRVVDRLPAYLGVREQRATRESKSELALVGAGSVTALVGTAAAVRQETAAYIVIDEGAFIRNQEGGLVLTGAMPAADRGGKLVVVSTGNGRAGNGAWFARLWDRAVTGSARFADVFLSWRADPHRTDEWREGERGNYPTDALWKAEYPETPEEALAGEGAVKVYPYAQLEAARQLGEWMDDAEASRLAAAASGVEWGIDWGDFQTAAVYAADLGELGLVVIDELAQMHTEATEAAVAIMDARPGGIEGAVFSRSFADSNPAGTNRTFAAQLAHRRDVEPHRFPELHEAVVFGVFKEGGADRARGVHTVNFVRYLLARSEAAVERLAELEPEARREAVLELSGVLAVSPRCTILLRQLAELERDPETEKVRKPHMNPNDPTAGDHFPDALVALCADRALRWTELLRARQAEQED